ncbi:chemotaxis protein CheX [Pseudobdellovibrio exovorus]|uniref:Chemotaxis phosphatase CheX-like domain-containing protein n=1 Tax=Pseudobdellovibrio exovorus JSS TaxID=1184267 RepID=M4VN74_9BACT|nr:chemotaxis protein CheX [Pseudobdellovibrio exovorus]AGH94524.1 hypothetical protein A11Q_304 [Pseudobdellovibrio exovorus JSS]
MTEDKVQLIADCIKESVINTIQVQMSVSSQVTKVNPSASPEQWGAVRCISSLALDSDTFRGTLTLAVSEKALINIIEKLTGEAPQEITTENSDAAGELLNIIYSSARKKINVDGALNFTPSLPSTIIGANLQMATSSSVDTMLFFDCKSELGSFFIALSLRKKNKEQQH